MLYYDRIDISKGIDPTKSNESKKCMFATITFLIIHSNFKMLSLNIRGLFLSLLEMMIIVVLFIALPNLKQ